MRRRWPKTVAILNATGDKILSMKAEEGHSGSHAAQCGAVVDDRRTFAHSHGMPLAAVLYLKRVEARARGESIGVREVTPMSAMWQLAYQLRGARSSKPILSMSRIEA